VCRVYYDPSELNVEELKSFLKEGEAKKGIPFDYIISSNKGDCAVCIERKDAGDFVSSIVDGRIWEQLYHLSSMCSLAILIVVGSPTVALIERKFPRSAYIGALASIALKHSPEGFRVSVLVLETIYDFIEFLRLMCRKVDEDDILLPVRPVRKTDLNLLQIQTIATLPGVGEVYAKKLLEKFGSIYNLVNASVDEIEKVVGKKRAEKIYRFIRGVEQ